MRVLLLGAGDDARGFALAGCETRALVTRREVELALVKIADEARPVGLVLVTAEVAALAPRALRAAAERPNGPPLVVLPAGPHSGGGS